MPTPTYSLSLDEFRRYAKEGNLIPLYREILADYETPVSAFAKIDHGPSAYLLESVQGTTASLYFVPDVFGISIIQGRLQDMNGVPVVGICETPFTGTNELVKRVSDVILACIILVLISPLLLAVAMGIWAIAQGHVMLAVIAAMVFVSAASSDAEERAYRAGQIDVTMAVPSSKVPVFKTITAPMLRVLLFFPTLVLIYLAVSMIGIGNGGFTTIGVIAGASDPPFTISLRFRRYCRAWRTFVPSHTLCSVSNTTPSYLATLMASAASISGAQKEVNAGLPCSRARMMPFRRGRSAMLSPIENIQVIVGIGTTGTRSVIECCAC